MQAAFAVGHQAGALARAGYPEGILVSHDDDLRAALKETNDLFARRRRTPVFEAAFVQWHDTLVDAHQAFALLRRLVLDQDTQEERAAHLFASAVREYKRPTFPVPSGNPILVRYST